MKHLECPIPGCPHIERLFTVYGLADHIVGLHPQYRKLAAFALAVSESFPGVDIDKCHRAPQGEDA